MSWTAAVDYSPGRRHRRDSRPCQDYGQLAKLDDNLILGAIADGAGTCPLGHLGAQAAVGAVMRNGIGRFRAGGAPRAGSPRGPDTTFAAVIEDSIDVARDAIARTARDHAMTIDALATTLLVFVAGPLGLVVAQVGDSVLVYRDAAGGYRLAIAPDRGEFANETVFVTDAAAHAETRIESHQGPVSFIAAFSDGLIPVSIANDDRKPHAPF